VKLTTDIHLVSRLRIHRLCLNWLRRLYVVVINLARAVLYGASQGKERGLSEGIALG
jgi:hypothetical protein